jgi:hypothetical protein
MRHRKCNAYTRPMLPISFRNAQLLLSISSFVEDAMIRTHLASTDSNPSTARPIPRNRKIHSEDFSESIPEKSNSTISRNKFRPISRSPDCPSDRPIVSLTLQAMARTSTEKGELYQIYDCLCKERFHFTYYNAAGLNKIFNSFFIRGFRVKFTFEVDKTVLHIFAHVLRV